MGKSLSSLVLFVLLMLLPGLRIASTTYILHSLKSISSWCRHEDKKTFLHSYITTLVPKFLGLNQGTGIWPTASYGKDVIIGVIDTGIWPESESFNDEGMSKVPLRWKGKCEEGMAFSPSLCNNKLIGARSFSKGLQAAGLNVSTESDFDSPRDFKGHGTHTSSTAAGNFVFGANYFGYAKVVATGVAPRAYLAIYKVSWKGNYSSAYRATDILAGMDQAVSDGVDVMSISLAQPDHTPYFQDVIAIASLSAVERGIVVVCAAGNSGPKTSSVFNGAPWIMTVGAGTMDRSYLATLELGNGLTFQGTTYFPASVSITNTLLYYGSNDSKKAACLDLDPKDVKGKIVICDNADLDLKGQMYAASMAGAYGAIFLTESFFLDLEDYPIPGILLHASYATVLKEYAMTGNSSFVKKIKILLTKIGTGPAPQVAYFSSRGPDPVSPSVLKPDILAPGVDVLGAVRPDKPLMEARNYNLLTDYARMSGTSMAAPHIAGVVALVKAVHREWSPAAIRSAIMTTSTKTDNTHRSIQDQQKGLTATPLDFGAGHVNPNRAMDPGLVYDMGSQDYIDFLCGLGYTAEQMMTVIRRSHWSCSENQTDLNYPSFMVNIANQTIFPYEKHFKRTITNVGDSTSTYRAVLEVPDGMIIRVEPDIIRFTSKYQKQDFVLSVEVENHASKVTYGYLKWIDDNNHTVSSPIVVI